MEELTDMPDIDMTYLRKILLDLLVIPSVGGDCDEAMKMVASEFADLGVTVTTTKKGALIGTIPGKDKKNHRVVTAHVDTLGAVVRRIKDTGRLSLLQIGGFAWSSVEGENILVRTMDGREYSGVILPEKASIHAFSEVVRETLRTDDTIEVRLDEDVATVADVRALGIEVGDFVFFQPRAVVTENGFVKSRFLDDKACIAMVFAAIRAMKASRKSLAATTHFYISNYEEVGHGVSWLPEEAAEIVALDVGIVAPGTNSSEKCVSIAARDSRTPYDLEFRKRLVDLAKKHEIDYRVDVYYRYGSDASVGTTQGFNANFACFGPGVDASHHYERTHLRALEESTKLLIAYLAE
jgi:putative aminopeptidase FrvX